jgi:peptidoglycan hydrolase-like protein with peptidoglycan-binding domain
MPHVAADPFRQSLRRSRERREQARRRRRWQLRKRSVSLMLCAVMVLGGGAAIAAGGGSQNSSVAVGMLSKGSSGQAVATVQSKLGIPADGSFGPQTARAVRRFQRQHGLIVDGVVGPQTLAALGLGSLKLRAPLGGQGGSGQGSSGTGAGGHLEKIAQCESGGNPQAIGGGGKFRGKYQFTRASWRAVGGAGDPAQASEVEQDQRARALYAQQGPSAWPNCA